MFHRARWTRHGLKGLQTLVLLLSTILLLPLFTTPVSSTPAILTQRTWGGGSNDFGNGVAVDSSGNTYVTGLTYSFGAGSPTYFDIVLIKYDSSGTLVWQKTWGASNTYDSGRGVAVDSSGNVYVAGTNGTGVPGFADVVLLKFDSTGLLLWQKVWGGSSEDQAASVAVDSSGSIYVTGIVTGFGTGGQDAFLLKFAASGSLLWQKTWGGSGIDEGRSVTVDSSGNIYLTGRTSFGASSGNLVVLKLDSSGNLLWHKMWEGANSDDGQAVAVDSSGNIYVAGRTFSYGAGGEDVVLLKFDSTGAFVWQRTWGGSGADAGQAIAVTSSGSILVAGRTDSYGVGLTDAVLLRFDSSGGLVWQIVWGGSNNDQGLGLALGPADSAIMTGYVSEAQPYTLGTPTGVVNNPSFTANPTGNSTLGTPTFALSSPANTPGTPTGSQTYAEGNDIFLLSYGEPPTQPATESSPLLLYVAVGVIAAALVSAIAIFFVRRRKKSAQAQGKPPVGQNTTNVTS